MLKSFTLKPSKDILSYKDHKEYPFILFPTIVLIYDRRQIIKLDNRELTILYNIGYNKNDSTDNIVKINFHSIKNPSNILVENSDNYEKLNAEKFNKIKKLLPFSKDVNNIIIKLAKIECMTWVVKKQRTCRTNNVMVNKYTIIDETKIPYDILKNTTRPFKTNLYIQKVVYGVFNHNSYTPLQINVTYFDEKYNNGYFLVDNTKITKLLYFTKEIKHNHCMSDDEDNLFETEDLSIDGYFKKLNLT